MVQHYSFTTAPRKKCCSGHPLHPEVLTLLLIFPPEKSKGAELDYQRVRHGSTDPADSAFVGALLDF